MMWRFRFKSQWCPMPFFRDCMMIQRFLQYDIESGNPEEYSKLLDDTITAFEQVDRMATDLAESAEQIAAQQEAEARAKREAEDIQARNDSIMAVQQEQAEKDKKLNIWMIIGGVILAILAFIGNQVFQSFRNNRNQMNMMNIQRSIANRAEAEAKRQARNAIRSTTNRTVNQAKSKVREAVRKKNTIKVNGESKNFSI